MMRKQKRELLQIGWREWVALPDLGIPRIKAKIDTGARTSSLHVVDLQTREEEGILRAYFKVHPQQRSHANELTCAADVIDRRLIRDSGGHESRRIVISSTLFVGDRSWPIELTLADRSRMGFRVLLGRAAMRRRLLINPAKSYLAGDPGVS